MIIHINMVSVENLYWILYQNLLHPLGIDCWYFYPWGTRQNLSACSEFMPWSPKAEHHVLFHDQEPFWSNDLGSIYDNDCIDIAWTNKLVKILANSEKSSLKQQICKDRYLIDWYFFYHAFAAQDWYRDARYIDEVTMITKPFLSFNRLIKDHRSHRISFLARLLQRGVDPKSCVSFHGTVQHLLEEIDAPHTLLSDHSKRLIRRNLDAFTELVPLRLDAVISTGDLSARFGHNEYRMWQDSLLHVVTETVFYQPKLHLTEKIFRPIVSERPFVLVAAPGNLRYLQSYGFQTFSNWIDESYDDIQDPDSRLDAIADIVSQFACMTPAELREIEKDMRPILIANKRHFFGEFRHIIVNELVDNFDQCIRIWNNGRIDNRQWPRIKDLDRVKKILLQ